MTTVQFAGTPAMGGCEITNHKVADGIPPGSFVKIVAGAAVLATLTDVAYGVAGVEIFSQEGQYFQAILTRGHAFALSSAAGVAGGVVDVETTQVINGPGAETAGMIVKIF